MEQPTARVTVVTPTFNRAGLLAETVESILQQRFEQVDYVVVDDGSTDDTAQLLARYPQIRILSQANQGEAAATNRGWVGASTEYVAVVSSDDPVKPGWLQTAVAFMDAHPDVLVGYPD